MTILTTIDHSIDPVLLSCNTTVAPQAAYKANPVDELGQAVHKWRDGIQRAIK